MMQNAKNAKKNKQTNKKKQLAIKNKYMKPNIFSNDNEL